jgi:hypothetical protein
MTNVTGWVSAFGAVVTASGVVGAALAKLISARRAQNARLNLSASKSSGHVLSLRLTYRPKNFEEGVVALAELLEPKAAAFTSPERESLLNELVWLPNDEEEFEKHRPKKRRVRQLLHRTGQDENLLACEFMVRGETAPRFVRVAVKLLREASGRRIAGRRTFFVSPIGAEK